MVSRFVARVLQIRNVTQSGSGKFWRGTRIARLGRAAPSPSGRNAHDRALLRTLARHEKDAALTLAWRNVIGAGFALPRDAGRRSGAPLSRAIPPSGVCAEKGAVPTVGVSAAAALRAAVPV